MAENNASVMLKVEGRVVSDTSSLLEAECLHRLATGHKVVLDLAGVMLIDSRGVSVLRGLKARNVEVINCWPLIEQHIAGSDGR